MERLTLRSYVLSGVMLLAGGAFMISKANASPPKTEAWMISQAPVAVEQAVYVENPEGTTPGMTYKMDKQTYDLLHPYGIVCRAYNFKGLRYDAVMIASRSKDSFHDPRVCFNGQGWLSNSEQRIDVPTQKRGSVPLTFVRLSSEKQGGSLAAFCYKSANGFVPTTNGLKLNMFVNEVLTGKQSEGVFYRFIANDPSVTEESFKEFIGKFLDAADDSSKGFF